MRSKAKPPRENRTITVDFQNEVAYLPSLGDGKAFLKCVIAFVMAIGFQLKHKATCGGGGCMMCHSHYTRVRLGGVPIWRIQCTTCRAVFTVLPHYVLRYRHMPPEVARNALIATHGGLRLGMLCRAVQCVPYGGVSLVLCPSPPGAGDGVDTMRSALARLFPG